MKYFFLESRSSPGDPIAEGITIPATHRHHYFGRKLSPLKKPIRVPVSKGTRPLTDLIQGPFTYTIASERLRSLFDELGSPNIYTLPVDVLHKSRVVAKYHFIQVLNNVDAIDWSKSDLESYPEDKYGVVKVRKLVLAPDVVGKRHVFRLAGLSVELGVSDLFRKRVLDAGMTGMRFVPTEDFTLS